MYPKEMWQLRGEAGDPIRDREAELVLAARDRIKHEMEIYARIDRPLDPMHLAQLAVHAVFSIIDPRPEPEPWACPNNEKWHTSPLFCHCYTRDPGWRERMDEKLSEQIAERKELEMHRDLAREHDRIGGSRTWYSAWHGERDR